jgi:hypothetical protein
MDNEADQQGVHVMIKVARLDRSDSRADRSSGELDEETALQFGALLTDLKRLRKGRGICTVDIQARVGGTLRAVAGIRSGDGPVEIRNKVLQRLQNLSNSLPDDLRIAALTAFAIASDARQPLYKDRVNLTASRISRDPRTARRRMDDAIVALAQLATARTDQTVALGALATTDWYFAELVLSLALDRDRPEIVEQGRIVTEADHVTEIDLQADRILSYTVAERVSVDRDVLYGGSIEQYPSADRRRGRLIPARPLGLGQLHEYAVSERILSKKELRPSAVFTPTVRCDRFVLRIRFPRADVPVRMSRLGPPAENLAVDRAGELHVEFRDLSAGREYGLRWEWPEPAARPDDTRDSVIHVVPQVRLCRVPSAVGGHDR